MADDFDWNPENEDVVMTEQRATAVYLNRWGQAVIRQERAWDEEADTFVIIDHAHLPAVIKALQAIADAPADRDRAPPAPTQQTPVERAKARAEAKSEGIASGSVTDLNEHVARQSRKSFGLPPEGDGGAP